MNHSVLIADDEEDVLKLVGSSLKVAGFKIVEAQGGAEALEKAFDQRPSLIVLDVMLPEMSGLELCRMLKGDTRTRHIPIIMLTAKAQEIDRVVGLELGADDYVTKPFSPRELVLRVKSQIRRSQGNDEPADTLRAGDLVLDRLRHSVTVKGKPVLLTATEFKLLSLLMERSGRVQTREILLNEVWGYDVAIQSRTVDIHVRRLREKLGRASDCIETVRGFGYRIAEVNS
jgi:two-component system phosphate regulon response regulator PhoB